ncbi:MAG TPA: hypothetical protein DCS97_10195 [Planctomycetes bacterium]|nr:hypothetical protein [Planctomycetota bacterium]
MAKRDEYHRDDHRDGISVDRLPSGSWRARVWDKTLRRYRTVTRPTEKAAKAEAEHLRANFTLGRDNAALCTLDVVWDAYARENYGLSAEEVERLADGRGAEPPPIRVERLRVKPRTIESMCRVIAGLRKAGATDFKAAGFRAQVSAYFAKLELSRTKSASGKVAVSTRRRMTAQMRAVVNFARNAGWLPTDPLANFTAVGKREQNDTTREVFGLDEIRRLVAVEKYSDPVWVHTMLMLYAGLRDAEARAVTWEDYEADRRLLWVQKGKGNKRRAVTVQYELADILTKVSKAMGPTAQSACLPSTPIARPVVGRGLASFAMFVKLLKDAKITRDKGTDKISGMPRRLTRHALRHTYCAAMLATGEPGDNLRIMMGHGTEDLTAHYGAQVATFKASVEDEGWERGRLCFRSSPGERKRGDGARAG